MQYWTGTAFKKFKYWDKLSSHRIFTIFSDTKDNLWIGTENGLNYYHNDSLQVFSTKNGLYNNIVKAITETKDGIIWIGTNTGLNFYEHGKFYKFKLPGEAAIYNIESFFIDDIGRLWIGTYGQGLYCYYENKVSAITKNDGLLDNVILTIIKDKSNDFWMSSNSGLFKVKEKNLTNFISGKDKNISSFVYQKSDGFLNNEFNGGNNAASCMLDDGTLLFASMGGVVAVDPSLKDKFYLHHKIFISNVTVNGKNTFKDTIIVPSDDNDIVFHFSVIRFNKPNQIRLFFRIKNLSSKWIWLKNKRSLNFADIPTGNYLLELKKVIGNGKRVAYTSKKLIVLPKFYQTNLFYFLLFLSLIGIFVFLIKIRFASLEKKKRMLQKTVEERTLTILHEKEKVEKIRILVGINANRQTLDLIEQAKQNQMSFTFSHKEIHDQYATQVIDEMDNSEDDVNVEIGVQKFIEFIKSGKLEIKAYPSNDIHAKVYIIRKDQNKSDEYGKVITGSSNFSITGLKDNLEFNVELKDSPDVKFALSKFKSLWKDAVDLSAKYIETIKTGTWLNDEITPYELYLKFLYEYLKEKINIDQADIYRKYQPANFIDLEYQNEAVKDAKDKIEQYGGVFLADVVGLGKTYISAMLANQLEGRTLIICPPVLKEYWQETFSDFRVPADVESLGKLDKLIAKGVEKYQNVFIDEAHRFRNETTQTYDKLKQVCWGRRVILVSATPLNNSPDDILSQLKLFQKGHNSTIPNVRDLEKFFARLRRHQQETDRRD